MQEGAEIVRRVWRAAQLRRLPLWIAGALPWLVIRSAPGLIAWIMWCAWDWAVLRRRVSFEWTAWLDGAVPEMEDSSALIEHAATPVAQLQRRRLLDRLDASVSAPQLRTIAGERVKLGAPWLLGSLVAAAVVWYATGAASQGGVAAATGKAQAAAAAPAAAQLVVRTAPPGYTGVAALETAPKDLQVPEQTVVTWCLKDPSSAEQPIEVSNGQVLKPGKECARWTATESVFWRWQGKRYTIKVIPDQPPEITITAPTQMVQELLETATNAQMGVKVTDDYLITRATLHMTLARGSGENIRFTDREMPLPASPGPKQRNWAKNWSIAELGMEPGDELYFFVRATDNAARAHTVQSPTYTLRLPAPPEQAEEESAAMPVLVKPQSLRSQRQIIIDTEQLVADMRSTKMSEEAVRDRSQKIANDQGALRRRYGQFLGEESSLFSDGEDDHDDHGGQEGGGSNQDILHQYGHAHDEAENATLFDEETKKVLRRALSAMWDAEKALRAITPKVALPPEHKALEAIKELQQAERVYLHKTAFVPPPIKEEKRMSGDMDGTASYRREQGGPDKRVPEDVSLLVQALTSDGPLPALWTRTAHDWVRSRLQDDDQRLAAQTAIQDVADGCVPCRPVLRAWLRQGAGQGQVLLQARPTVETPFVRAWREGVKP
ncbi:DUF4175 domain-containing protein [Massilia sp. IC2-477]|uniref:DUF4175 family protein n=1 Tax=Massilia sp. IC2-477 TaxID=2887198 RepID=UPI001D0FB93C|nr:DUF4175 family protein [Massilia sp. IC2-477]MCC2958459.1 DUF4175 domain-containing protein [Massilia sp. IC2-477]